MENVLRPPVLSSPTYMSAKPYAQDRALDSQRGEYWLELSRTPLCSKLLQTPLAAHARSPSTIGEDAFESG